MKQVTYSVWVGGGEVNDFALTLDEAQQLEKIYLDDGYDDVSIEQCIYGTEGNLK